MKRSILNKICLPLLVLFPVLASAQITWKADLLNYIHKLKKVDGGYGWEDQPDAHLTPTYAIIGILNDLDMVPEKTEPLVTFIRTHHPQRGLNKEAGPSGTEERDLVYQQMQSLAWLSADLAVFSKEVLAWRPQDHKVSNFEEHGYPVFLQEMMSPVCRGLLKVSQEKNTDYFTTYLASRRRENGSFNNAPSAGGGDGNILNTYWGLLAMQQLHQQEQKPQLLTTLINWIKSCQLKNGGFTHQPNPVIAVNEEIAYTWAAIKSLHLLAALPSDKNKCIRYLHSLHNNDGGFANHPGLPSTPMATYYAVDALKTLDALSSLDTVKVNKRTVQNKPDFLGLKVYTVQFEATGSGSPEEAVMLADSLHINLWGCKNSNAAWREKAQHLADSKKVPVVFFQSDEAYGKSVTVQGMGTFSHIMDYIAPALANKKPDLNGSSWQSYHKTFIQPLLQDQGALILQVTNNEPLGRMILDESIMNGGFTAISTIHFGQNFSFWLPWLNEYRHQLPFISLQDAHGTESWWWTAELIAHRTLFLARKPTYNGMMEAMKNNLLVAVRHDSLSNYKTRMLGGAQGVQEYVQSKQTEWSWWEKDSLIKAKPWAAITVIEAPDTFEVARPVSGVNIRIRCEWSGIRQMPGKAVVTLEKLTINGKPLVNEYVEKKDGKGMVTDAYFLVTLPDIMKGNYTVEAALRSLKTNEIRKIQKIFSYHPDAGEAAEKN